VNCELLALSVDLFRLEPLTMIQSQFQFQFVPAGIRTTDRQIIITCP